TIETHFGTPRFSEGLADQFRAPRAPVSVSKDEIGSSDGRRIARSTRHQSRRRSEESQRPEPNSSKNPRTAPAPCRCLNSKNRPNARTASRLELSPHSSPRAQMRRHDLQPPKQLQST